MRNQENNPLEKTIVGILACEPEIIYTADGQATCIIKVLGEKCDHCGQVEKNRVVATGDLAENIALSLSTGHKVIAYGVWDEDKDQILATHVGPTLAHATADIQERLRIQITAAAVATLQAFIDGTQPSNDWVTP